MSVTFSENIEYIENNKKEKIKLNNIIIPYVQIIIKWVNNILYNDKILRDKDRYNNNILSIYNIYY
jgi:hypothetical protein